MSLRDARTKTGLVRRSSVCHLTLVREDLSVEDNATLDEWLADKWMTGTEIARILTADGHKIAPSSVQRHRRQECTCES